MKKIVYSLFIIAVLLFSFSCRKAKKDYNDYLPKIKIISAEVQADDGSVLVKAEIESEGEGEILRAGFCCGTNNPPEMLDRQIICNSGDGIFTASYQLSADSAYHFRAWATNKYGYTYSEVITLDSVTLPAVVVPCTITNETVSTGTTFGNGTYYGGPQAVTSDFSSGLYKISATTYTGTVSIDVYMNLPLSQGMYTTTASTPGSRQMYFAIQDGSVSSILNGGTPVYVNQISPGIFDVTVCSAPWQFTTTTTLYFKTHFTASNL